MKKRILTALSLCLSFFMLAGCTGEGTPNETKKPEDTADSGSETLPEETGKVPTGDYGANPIIATLFTADPSAHVWEDGKLYIYASHDVFPSRGCDLMDRYHVFSTTNLVDYADEGEILSSDDLDWGTSGFMWAPDCAYKDGKYYFYFPHPESDDWNATWRVGVAVSDKPAGGFDDAGMMMNPDGKTPVGAKDGTGHDYNSMIDPCVFRDDDGTYYLFVGGGSHLYRAKIADDMLSLAEPLTEVPSAEIPDYHEGPWVFVREGKYYLIYADNAAGANCMRYSVADDAEGPYTPGGVFLTAVKDCDTTHGSIVEFKGEWYLFYHNAAISGNGTLRSVCVDKVEFEDDGSIRTVVQTETGVKTAGPRAAIPGDKIVRADVGENGGEGNFTEKKTYSSQQFTCGGGCNISDTCAENMHLEGAWCEISGVDGGKGGKALVTFVYSSADTAATALVKSSADPTGEGYFLALRGNGSWSDFTAESSILVDLKPGTDNVIRVEGGMFGFNLAKIIVATEPAD